MEVLLFVTGEMLFSNNCKKIFLRTISSQFGGWGKKNWMVYFTTIPQLVPITNNMET